MDDKKELLKDQLYQACEEKLEGPDETAYNRSFSQEDLQNLPICRELKIDLKSLMGLVQSLTNDRRFIPLQSPSGPVWRLRPQEEANKYRGLEKDQVLVYSWIDNAGGEGIWQQTLRNRTGITQDQQFKNILKQLETKRLITSFMSVQNASHRCWIKASIKPSIKVTGGPWYADGDLDESFINILLNVVFDFIKDQGSYSTRAGGGSTARGASTSPVLPKKVLKGKESDIAVAARGRKRDADAITNDDESTPLKARRANTQQRILLPMPAGYNNYITLTEITERIAAANITRGTKLKESDVKQLLDVLIYDSRIEEIKVGRRVGYRAMRISKHDPANFVPGSVPSYDLPSNGLTEAPCGRCPVFELCQEGGPVWAGGCEYFDEWLA
ncbi:DNA-directed RNA polymerase III subunit RPC6 [Apiospora kogelbergensis]|uniref:DNA-directed RNA polymerase III subunit RPC6 n=1 Tax=Apiospora kogelbergensis TaxID=1337665 RepID=A0AAW0QBT4_9PEZI